MSKFITIEPASRLEGEAKISIFLDENGNVKDAFFQVIELRGFEQFCIGRPVEEMPRITSRICGVCSWAHHMASAKAADIVFGREITETARRIRELSYNAHIIYSHTIHFYIMAAADFLLSPEISPSRRNIIGLLKERPEIVKQALKLRLNTKRIQEIIGGKATHPTAMIPGGVSKPVSLEERDEIAKLVRENLELAEKGLELFENEIYEKFKDEILAEENILRTYYVGLVDERDCYNFYDGLIKVVDPNGKEYAKFKSHEYRNHIAEHVESWCYSKFPYLKNVGWKGFVDGVESGIYRVGPLARLNVTDECFGEKANEHLKKMREELGNPVHHTLAFHWARLIEILDASERMLELLSDDTIIGGDILNTEGEYAGEGVGVVEAPRGLLIHHYIADENGLVKNANIIVATTCNMAAINLSVKNAAKRYIKRGKISDKVLNMVEIAFRAYDPCLACATHSLPGLMNISLTIYDSEGNVVKRLRK